VRCIRPLRIRPPRSNTQFVAKQVQPYAVDAAWPIVSKSLIDRCHAAGVLAFSDALGLHDTPSQYDRAIREGIDLIQTDHPVRVLRALELLER
jgi:glycerophosphoryl diester phosphodiesterase